MDRKTFCQILNSHLNAIQAAFNELIETDKETKKANDEQKKVKGEDTSIYISLTVSPDYYSAWALTAIKSGYNKYCDKYKKLFEVTKTQGYGLHIDTKIRKQ